MAFCSNCGKQIPEGASFCTSCGTAVANSEKSHQQQARERESEKEREVAYIRTEIAAMEKRRKSAVVSSVVMGVCAVILLILMDSTPRLREISWLIWMAVIVGVINVIIIFVMNGKIEEKRQQLRNRETY